MNLRERIEKQESLLEMTEDPIKNAILENGPYCSYCGQTRTKWTMDHVTPKSRKKGRIPRNKVLCCETCNQDKANRTPLEWFWDASNNPRLYWPWRVMDNRCNSMSIEALRVAERHEWNEEVRLSMWGKLLEYDPSLKRTKEQN